jgi:transposase
MTKLRAVATDTQVPGAAPTPGERITLGVDLARTTWKHAVVWGAQVRRELATPGALEHVAALVARFQPQHPVRLIYEACGFGYELAWWAQAHGVEVIVVAPSQVERAPGPRVKTDRLDARTLALKGAKGDLKPVAIPSRAQHEQRQLLRTYAQVMRDRQRAQVRLRALFQEHGRLGPAPRSGWAVYEHWLESQVLPDPVAACVSELRTIRASALLSTEHLERRLRAVAQAPAYRPLVKALTTLPGVGEFSAIRVLLEVGDITRFGSADAWTHYLGLTPSEYSTGEGPPHRGPIRKCGPKRLRAALVQCAWAAIRRDADLRATFARIAARAQRKRAIIAVTRRLARRLRARWLEALAPPSAAA